MRRGAFVVVVGPDGVGKTTAARALVAGFPGPTAYFHFRPPVRRRLMPNPPAYTLAPPSKGGATGSIVLGWSRLFVNMGRFWVGYLLRVRPAVRSGSLVVADRWAYGYLAQPRALKFYGPSWLARMAIGLMPQPDLVVNLVAPATTIHVRKDELTLQEIESELEVWSGLCGRTFRTFDATLPPGEIAEQVLHAVNTLTH